MKVKEIKITNVIKYGRAWVDTHAGLIEISFKIEDEDIEWQLETPMSIFNKLDDDSQNELDDIIIETIKTKNNQK